MNRFIVINILFLIFSSNIFGLYIPYNLPKFNKNKIISSPVMLNKGNLFTNKEYVKVVFKFRKKTSYKKLEKLGVVKLFGDDKNFSAYIPYYNLFRLEEVFPDLISIENPMKPISLSVSGEEINLLKITSFWNNGFMGENIKVAVIDGGFYGYQDAIANGDLPEDVVVVNYSTTPIDAADGDASAAKHGTAVAEIIYEIAPMVKLYLIKIEDGTSLINARDYCIKNGIRIINHSLGWPIDGWGEGDGFIYKEIVEQVFNNDILWINSAGNSAKEHYQAEFTDNGVGWHNFTELGNEYGEIYISAGENFDIYLKWDAYDERTDNLTYSDYDLYLYDNTFSEVKVSSNRQNPYYPYEHINYTAEYTGVYYYAIKKVNASKNYNFQIFTFNSSFITPSVSNKSILPPTDGEYTLSVGAVSYSNWNKSYVEAEYFSSRGPTQDGRIKPDISGIDGMTNFTYGRFSGTSASAPVVSGIAALILSKQPYLSAYQLFYILKDNAIDIGDDGDDNIFGAGKVNLNLLPVMRNNLSMTSNVIIAPTRIKGDRKIYYYGVSDITSIYLKTIQGRLIKEFKPESGEYISGENCIDISNINLAPGIYIIEFTENGKKIYVKKFIFYN